jgi:hypothetical protein
MSKKQPPYRVVTPMPKDYEIKDPIALRILIRSAIRELQAERSESE